ncbi:MAG: hypothetical protein HOB79_14775 [Rhodospirillaceae bacterium]|nr:hypothetical protein [Rhodospirillales bacterium]MBT3904884.1 hypothetical protein [Rhodospirillaceae bacterium]MBT4702332.1 hypothetical protein [Rhodospirillaceae bacterium]MBT5034456.1 hypothetical protein [Rhodospirillaceae bacterium]MBT6220122.1 hypothetical protein [Rhodospirillaceae bacterium]
MLELAQATGGDAIGAVDVVTGSATVTRVDGTKSPLAKGDPVFQGDTIETGDGGSIGLIFIDDTTFALGESGNMVLDEVVFDPATKDGNFAAKVSEGIFSFVSGQISKAGVDNMTLETPVVTIGIRGTKGAGKAGPEGTQNSVSLLPNADGSVGEMSVATQTGAPVVISAVGATVAASSASAPPPPPVIFSPRLLLPELGGFVEL